MTPEGKEPFFITHEGGGRRIATPRIARLTMVSYKSASRRVAPVNHQMPGSSSVTLSAGNITTCTRVALPCLRFAHVSATRQLIGGDQSVQERANSSRIYMGNRPFQPI